MAAAACVCAPSQHQILGRTEHQHPIPAGFCYSLLAWAALCAQRSHSSPRNWVRKQVLLHQELLLWGAHEEPNCAQPQYGNSRTLLTEPWLSTGDPSPWPSFWASPDQGSKRTKAERKKEKKKNNQKPPQNKKQSFWSSSRSPGPGGTGRSGLCCLQLYHLPQQTNELRCLSLQTSHTQHPTDPSRYCHISCHFDTVVSYCFSVQV